MKHLRASWTRPRSVYIRPRSILIAYVRNGDRMGIEDSSRLEASTTLPERRRQLDSLCFDWAWKDDETTPLEDPIPIVEQKALCWKPFNCSNLNLANFNDWIIVSCSIRHWYSYWFDCQMNLLSSIDSSSVYFIPRIFTKVSDPFYPIIFPVEINHIFIEWWLFTLLFPTNIYTNYLRVVVIAIKQYAPALT